MEKHHYSQAPHSYLIPYPVESFSKPVLIMSGKASIGNDTGNTIRVMQSSVSPHHAEIVFENGTFFIIDLHSKTGTFVNKQRINKTVIKHHDKIAIGNQTFKFLVQSDSSGKMPSERVHVDSATIAVGEDEIEPGELWAQTARTAARQIFQASKPGHKAESEKTPSAHKRLSLLYQLSEKLRAEDNLDQILDKGLSFLLKAIQPAERATIMLRSGADRTLEVKALKYRDPIDEDGAIRMSRTVLDWVLTEKMALVSQNTWKDQRFQDSDSIRINSLNSIICVPLMKEDRVIGILYADSSNLFKSMTQEDAAFAAAVANELALCIENIRLQHKALINERMAAIGMTISNLSHNIRNLIALNQNAVDLMGLHLQKIGDEKINKSWYRIQESFARINHLSADMLEFAKEQKMTLKRIDINKNITAHFNFFQDSLTHGDIQFKMDLSPDNPWVEMDETQFQRALLNLMVNAIYAIGDKKNGIIKISTAVKKGQKLSIRVGDNGCGIDPEKQKKIFDLFYTSKGTDGSGLGLPMVQRFMERVGGRLSVQSKVGVGSIFELLFPKVTVS